MSYVIPQHPRGGGIPTLWCVGPEAVPTADRVEWARVTNALHKTVDEQKQSINELQNHAIIQQQQIDELRSVVEALVLTHRPGLIGGGEEGKVVVCGSEVLYQNDPTCEKPMKRIQSYVEDIHREEQRNAAEEEACRAAIALEVAKQRVADEKVAAEEARVKKKAETVSKMAARAKARLDAIATAERELEERTKTEMALLHAKRAYASTESEVDSDDDSENSEELLLVQQEASAALQAAEARVAAARQRGIQKGKRTGSTDPATWSNDKAEKISAMWCE